MSRNVPNTRVISRELLTSPARTTPSRPSIDHIDEPVREIKVELDLGTGSA